jgi:hypothetical protein
MSITAATLRKLAMLNLSSDQMTGVLDVLADSVEADEARRAALAERKRRNRSASRDSHVTVTGQSQPNPSPKEKSPTPPKEITPSSSEDKSSSLSPRDELRAVLDEGRAQAVVDHRKALGKKLTAHAAKLLADQFAKCPNPNEAADTMIANGWQGIKPEWMQRQRDGPRGASNVRPSILEVAARNIAHEQPDHIDPFGLYPRADQPGARRGDTQDRDRGDRGAPLLDLVPERTDRH